MPLLLSNIIPVSRRPLSDLFVHWIVTLSMYIKHAPMDNAARLLITMRVFYNCFTKYIYVCIYVGIYRQSSRNKRLAIARKYCMWLHFACCVKLIHLSFCLCVCVSLSLIVPNTYDAVAGLLYSSLL